MVKIVTAISIMALSLVVILTVGFVRNKSVESHQSENQNRVRIESKTPALTVQSLRELHTVQNSTYFEIAVRNVSPKLISAVILRVEDEQVGKGTMSFITEGGLFRGWSIQPNETKNIRFNAASTGNIVLTVAAIMFAGGETEGDAFFTDHLQKQRNGVRAGYQIILPILRKYMNPQATDIPDEVIQAMLNEIKSIDEKNIPSDLLGGFLDASKEITSDIEDSKKQRQRGNPRFNSKERLQKIADRTERALSTF